jgi:hypothetical protein
MLLCARQADSKFVFPSLGSERQAGRGVCWLLCLARVFGRLRVGGCVEWGCVCPHPGVRWKVVLWCDCSKGKPKWSGLVGGCRVCNFGFGVRLPEAQEQVFGRRFFLCAISFGVGMAFFAASLSTGWGWGQWACMCNCLVHIFSWWGGCRLSASNVRDWVGGLCEGPLQLVAILLIFEFWACGLLFVCMGCTHA